VENTLYEIVLVQDGTTPYVYVNGDLVSKITTVTTDRTYWFSGLTGIDNGRIGCMNNAGGGNTNFSTFTVNYFDVWNKVPTATEVKDLYSNANIPFKYEGASQTALTTGSLVVGKEYIIDTFVAGDDFVNVGGTNVTGTVFTATGTSPTTWTNASSLRTQGNVADYNSSGVGHNQWHDNSGNENHGTVSGALPTNLPSVHSEKYIEKTITADTTLTSIVPAGYMLKSMVFEETAGNAGVLDLGTATTGSQVFLNQTITASDFTTVVINKVFSLTADTTLYLNDDDASSGWNSASVDIYVTLEKIK